MIEDPDIVEFRIEYVEIGKYFCEASRISYLPLIDLPLSTKYVVPLFDCVIAL